MTRRHADANASPNNDSNDALPARIICNIPCSAVHKPLMAANSNKDSAETPSGHNSGTSCAPCNF
eukprot:2916672-Amphidinium_carterae.1